VRYAGSAPGDVNGFAQVNVEIPASAPVGSAIPLTITFTSRGVPSNTQQGVTVTVQ
jgi:uncharacterized protein (TIGR03437 family)